MLLFNEPWSTSGFRCTTPEDWRNGWWTWSGRTGVRPASRCSASTTSRSITSTGAASLSSCEKTPFPRYFHRQMTHRTGEGRSVVHSWTLFHYKTSTETSLLRPDRPSCFSLAGFHWSKKEIQGESHVWLVWSSHQSFLRLRVKKKNEPPEITLVG